MIETKYKKTPASANRGGESDIVSFWLLLLFVAVFFGIAAEEARHPMFGNDEQRENQTSGQNARAEDKSNHSDLISSEQTTRASK